jgi:multidrug resistance efflux pump
MKVRFRSSKQQAPDRDQGMRVAYAPAKRVMARWRWYLILLLVSAPLIYLLGQILYGWLMITAPGYVALRKVPINSPLSGVLADRPVTEGQTVQLGAVLARLKSPDLDRREAVLAAELNAREKALLMPRTRSDQTGVHRRLALAAEVVRFQRGNRDDVRFLFDQGAATRAELNLAENALREALLHYENVQFDATRLQAQVNRVSAPDEEALVRLEVLRAELGALGETREALELRSPLAGRVLELFAETGQSMAPGDPVLMLGDTAHLEIHAYLAPRYAAYAKKGQPVTVRFKEGYRLSGVVIRNPEVTRRLPAAVSSPLGSRENKLLVPIVLTETASTGTLVEGLPVTVRFPFQFLRRQAEGGLAISDKTQ